MKVALKANQPAPVIIIVIELWTKFAKVCVVVSGFGWFSARVVYQSVPYISAVNGRVLRHGLIIWSACFLLTFMAFSIGLKKAPKRGFRSLNISKLNVD